MKTTSTAIGFFLLLLLANVGANSAHAAAILEPQRESEATSEVQGTTQRQLRKIYEAGLENYKNHQGMSEASIREELKFNLNRSLKKITGLSENQKIEMNQKKKRFEEKLDRSSKEALLNIEANSLNQIYSKLDRRDQASVMYIDDWTSSWWYIASETTDPFEKLFAFAVLPFAVIGDGFRAVLCFISFNQLC